MADRAVFSLILDDVERRLKTETTFPGVGGYPEIKRESIVVRDAEYTADTDQEQFKQVSTPGLVITPGNVARPATHGTNVMDDAHYHVLVQLIDRGDQRFNRNRLDSHLLWCERIARTWHGYTPQSVEIADAFEAIVWCEQTTSVDERMFYRHERFVRGVLVRFRIREPRGVT